MSYRVAALIGASIAILGVLLYLWVAVRAVHVPEATASAAPAPPPAPTPSPEPEPEPVVEARSATTAAAAPAMPSEPAPIATDLASDPKLELSAAMDQANRYYDRQEHDAAQEAALKILERDPGNIRMLRIVVSTACMMGEPDKAQRYWTELPERDRAQMTTRCARFGVAFKE